jgi:hypothetical protein
MGFTSFENDSPREGEPGLLAGFKTNESFFGPAKEEMRIRVEGCLKKENDSGAREPLE